MTDRTKSEFTSHFGIAVKTNLLLLFPTRYAHARYSSRMIDRFLNWGDHGKPKSGKIKGRCPPPPDGSNPMISFEPKFFKAAAAVLIKFGDGISRNVLLKYVIDG